MPLPPHLAERLKEYRSRKPKYFNLIVALLGIYNLAGYPLILRKPEDLLFEFIPTTIFVILGYMVLWQFSRRRNWARQLVIIASALSPVGLVVALDATNLEALVLVTNALFGLFLLWWLNTDQVRAYFEN